MTIPVTNRRIPLLCCLAALTLTAVACGPGGGSGAAEATEAGSVTAEPGAAPAPADSGSLSVEGEAIEWEDSRVFIEHNAGSDDYGFHAEFGGEPWTRATITGPSGDLLLDLAADGLLAEHGLSGVFFESAEFDSGEVSREDFLARFPEGEYRFVGRTLEGDTMVGAYGFTHLVPDPPTIVMPAIGAVVDPAGVMVTWEPVTTPIGVLLPELFAPGETYEFELMAVDVNGNQAFSLGEFSVAG